MAITNIQVNFTPCSPEPGGGYNIVYRVVGDPSYIDAGNFITSPANISVSYPDGTLFEGIIHSPCGDVLWSSVPVSMNCGCRFAYPGEDELAAENRAFNLTAAYNFSFINGVNQLFTVIGSSGQILLGQYGVGTFADTPVYGLGVLADGTVIEYDPTASGGSTMRFAYPGEDDTAAEDRLFSGNNFSFNFDQIKDFYVTTPVDVDGTYQFFLVSNSNTQVGFATANGPRSASIVTETTFSGTQPYVIIDVTDGTNLAELIISPDDTHFSGNFQLAHLYVGTNTATPNPVFALVSTSTGGTVTNGFGCQFDMRVQNDAGAQASAISFIVTLTDVTNTAETSELTIKARSIGIDQNVFVINGSGLITLPLGLSDYADDTAAAAGTPVIPVNGLYRTGSIMKIRVT